VKNKSDVKSEDSTNWTRRIFVRESLKGWLSLVLAPAIYATTIDLIRARKLVRTQSKDVGAAESLLAHKSKTVLFGNTRVLVLRDGTGELHAVNAVCTHMGCSLRFEADRSNGYLACNCHESNFTLHGEIMRGPATRSLEEYRIEVIGGRLVLSESPGKSKNT
jgi:Rieske Fe-S protein